MQWRNVGSGVYESDNQRYLISRLPSNNGKKFILMRRVGGKLAQGSLAQCKAAAETDLQPYHSQLAQLAKKGVMSLDTFRMAFAS